MANQNEDLHRMVDNLTNAISVMTNIMQSMDMRMNKIEEVLTELKDSQQKLLPKYEKPYNPWVARMLPKYSLLEEYFGIERRELFRNIFYKLSNDYGVDTAQVTADYCAEHNISNCFSMEPFQNNPKYMAMIEEIVNNALIDLNIAAPDDPIASNKFVTIFDRKPNDKKNAMTPFPIVYVN